MTFRVTGLGSPLYILVYVSIYILVYSGCCHSLCLAPGNPLSRLSCRSQTQPCPNPTTSLDP